MAVQLLLKKPKRRLNKTGNATLSQTIVPTSTFPRISLNIQQNNIGRRCTNWRRFLTIDRLTRFKDRRQTYPSPSYHDGGKQWKTLTIHNNIYEILEKYKHLHPNLELRRTVPMPPLNFPAMPAGRLVQAITKVPSQYYWVPWYFLTVLTVAHNR